LARILVIEDEEAIRDLCKRLLVRAGHEVVDAANGEIGLRLYRQNPTDLIITDLFMPEKDGIETIRELRRDFPAAKIVAISGGAKSAPSVTFLRVANHLGAIETLAKPFSTEELLTAVARALQEE
jgi:CheY-like chemotaxis protein